MERARSIVEKFNTDYADFMVTDDEGKEMIASSQPGYILAASDRSWMLTCILKKKENGTHACLLKFHTASDFPIEYRQYEREQRLVTANLAARELDRQLREIMEKEGESGKDKAKPARYSAEAFPV